MRKSGVKFGLIGSASSLKKGTGKSKPIGSKPAPRRRPPGATSVFDANSDDEDGPKDDPSGVAAVNKRLAAISAKQEKQAKKEYEDALEADPSVFDYDRVYDGMKETRETTVAAATVAHEKEKRQPKYIGNLLKQAKMRAVESDRIFERKLQKEREEQDKVEGEATMKFVTSAYKKKLMEQKKWELQQKLEEGREQRNDVTKTGMSGFYSNLITKNIAMGGDVEKSANSAFTAGSKRHAATDDYDMQDGNAKPKAVNSGSEDESNAAQAEAVAALLEREEAGSDADGGEDAAPSARMVDPRAAAATAAAGAGERGDRGAGRTSREEESRWGNADAGSRAGPSSRRGDDRGDSREAMSEREVSGGGHGGGGTVRRRPDEAVGDGEGATKRHRPQVEEAGAAGVGGEGAGGAPSGVGVADGEADEGKGVEAGLEEERAAEELEKASAAVAAMEKKAKKEAAIKSARERFLARKKGP